MPSTTGYPWSNARQGIDQAIQQISEITGRPFYDDQGRLIRPYRSDGTGVDHFAITVSAAPPLETLLVGLFDDVSINTARHALNQAYTKEIDHFSLADSREEREQITAVLDHKPDLIFIVGGTDGGADERLLQLVETIGVSIEIMGDRKRPQVIYAGNVNLREQVRELFDEYEYLHVVNNVRPNLDTEHVGDAARLIRELYEDLKVNSLTGLQEVIAWSNLPTMSTVEAFAVIMKYFSAVYEGRVLGIDLGSNSTSFIIADPDNLHLTVRSDLGMGKPIVNLLSEVNMHEIALWLPEEIEEEEIQNFIYTKSLFPNTTPMTDEELHLEQAIIRQILNCVVRQSMEMLPASQQGKAAPFKHIVVRGTTFSQMARSGQVVLLLLDTLQAGGIFSVSLDRYGLLPGLGSVAAHDPLLVVQALDSEVVEHIGWVIMPKGNGRKGQEILHITVETEAGKLPDTDVEFGTLEIIALPPGQETTVTLKPSRGFDIGFGSGQAHTMMVQGGSVGLIIDARKRPLAFPQSDVARRSLIRQWIWDMGG